MLRPTTDEMSLVRNGKCLDFTRFDDGEILIEGADGNDRVFFTLDADAIESLKAFLGGEQPLESAAADDFNSSATSKDGSFLERLG